MLTFFRKLIGSKVGAFVAIGFLVLIGLAFAGGDIASWRNGPSADNGTIATVGSTRITTDTARLAATSALDNLKQSQPTMSMQGFVAMGGLARVIDEMVGRTAVRAWGEDHGVVAGPRLVDSEIVKIPAFLGPDGKFNQSQFRAILQQRGISETLVRDDIAQGLILRQVLVPAGFGASQPQSLAMRYAQLLKESRAGTIAALPAPLFAPATPPSDATLAAWYRAHGQSFIRPERRVLRYAVLDGATLKTVAVPTEAEIAARFQASAAQYAAQESRRITQLIVPDEAAARAVATQVAAGTSLPAAAQARGLAVSTLGPLTKAALAEQTTPAVADAVFAAGKGAMAAPARSGLGWHVVHVDDVIVRPARTLAQARGEIAQALAADKQRKALADLSSRVEGEFDGGSSLADAAKALGLAVAQTGPVTADGAIYGKVGEQAPPVLARVLKTAFAMDQENQPQIAEVDAGKTFVLFDVAQIAASAPAPLADIRGDVASAWRLEQGYAGAEQAARQVLGAVKRGQTLEQALAALKRPLPPPQPVAMSREDLARLQQQSRQPVPPPVALLFSMAQGTTKLLPVPGGRGWFVVSLRQIKPGVIAQGEPLVASVRAELGKTRSVEYAEALRRAIRDELGVKRNEPAITALRRQLAGNAATQ